VGIGHPGVVQAMVFGALAVSLTAVIGVGLGYHPADVSDHLDAERTLMTTSTTTAGTTMRAIIQETTAKPRT